jgi:glycosyltransferase involved in cell wall biosynthesis
MSRPPGGPLVSIALPVYNGAQTLAPVIESVLAQTHSNLELVISDNASTDDTEEVARGFARADRRVVYQRHPSNVGLLNNFTSAAAAASGTYLRWIGDDDSIAPEYVARTLEAFAEDERRVLVTTQILYTGADGLETLTAEYDPAALASPDPVERFAEMLRLLSADLAALDPVDPLYGMMRREVAVLPRRNMLREDEVFAARLALAGPWGHVPQPLARRVRHESTPSGLVHLLGVPAWHWHVRAALQCQELSSWIAQSSLEPAQRRRARAEVARMYVLRKQNRLRRGITKARGLVGVSTPSLAPSSTGATP